MMWQGLYKREFWSFFNNCSAYSIMFVYALLSMLSAFFFGVYFYADNQAMVSFFALQPPVMAIIIPAITMRSWSEEYKTGTIEVLLTFPLKTSYMVTAKYCACFSFSLLLMLFSLPLLLITMHEVEVDYLHILTTYIGLALLIGLFCAIGCAVSAMSRIPIVAYLLSVLLIWFVTGFNYDWLMALFSRKLRHATVYFDSALNFSGHYQSFVNGYPGADNLVYFVSFIIGWQVFNVAIVEAKRRR